MSSLGADSVVAPHFAAFLSLRRAIYTRTSCDMLKQDYSLSLGPQLAKCFDFHLSSDQYVAFFSVSSISTDWGNQASLCNARRLHLDILLLWPVKRSYEIVGFGHCHCHYCHSDRQFCVCSKIYIPPFVGSTTRSHNKAWETRWTGGSHRRMASTMMWVYTWFHLFYLPLWYMTTLYSDHLPKWRP